MSYISSFDIISVVVFGGKGEGRRKREEEWRQPDPKTFLCIPASAADAAAVHSKGIKTLLANGLTTFFIKVNPVFSNGPRSLSRNTPDCTILDNWVFDKLILIDDLLEKALRALLVY